MSFNLNAEIPLLAQVADPLGSAQRGLQVSQQFQQAPLQNQLLQQQVDQRQQALVANQKAAAATEQDRVITSLASGFQEISGLVDAGDFKGVVDVLTTRRARLVSEGKDTAITDEAIQAYQSGDATLINRANIKGKQLVDAAISRNLLQPTGGSARGGLASAKTEIFDNGTIIRQLPDGSSEVTNPAGDIVTGKNRVKVLKTAREEEIAFAGKQAASKAGGALDPKVSDLAADKQAKLDFQKSKSKFNDTISSTVSAIGSAKATNDIMTDTANEIKSFISGLNAVYGASLSGIPGSEAKRLKGLITTMKANSAFGTLIDLKASGGTLGAISASELELLAAKLGNLDQSGDIPEMVRVLDQILEQNSSSIVRMETAFASEKDRFSRGFGVEAPQAQVADEAPAQREGGVLQVDANGNRAMVFPDGTFEEVQ
ncbi:MAG: hypothetical protein JKY52_09285 [Flavobacteriales bacterium]|nr:hypothetical protein [Flavobacteriales bacterium]